MNLYKDLSSNACIVNLARNLDNSRLSPRHGGEVDHPFLIDADGYTLTDADGFELYSND